MKRNLLIIMAIVAVALAACGAAASYEQEAAFDGIAGGAAPPAAEAPVFADEVDYEYELAEEEAARDAAGEGGVDSSSVPGQAVERVVIKNASMSIVVEDVQGTVDTVVELAESMGGFVVSQYVYEYSIGYGSSYQADKAADLTVRVPAERLNEVLDRIRDMSVEVTSETVSGQDVTREYTDLQSRLRNLEATRDQLELIMEDAFKTEDVLAVYAELVRVNEEIEIIQGQLNYFSEAARLSAVSLSITPDFETLPVDVPRWSPLATAREAIEDLLESLQDLADFLIYFTISVLPILLIWLIPLFLIGRWIWKAWQRRRERRRAEAAAAASSAPVTTDGGER